MLLPSKYWDAWDAWARGTRWLIGGIAVLILAAALSWVLVVPAADWLAHHDVGSAKGSSLLTARDDARGRLLTLGAGLFAAGALYFTARNYAVAREGQVTDRYTKSIKQLGSKKLEVRLGGIYGLERIARDSAKDHPTVMEVLTAFVREHSHEDRELSIQPDIQAAVTVVGRRISRRDRGHIDLSRADLSYAKLADADLTHADLTHADLTHADFTGADLTDANLYDADVTDAYFFHANLAGVTWPAHTPVPPGWKQGPWFGGLVKARADSEPTEEN